MNDGVNLICQKRKENRCTDKICRIFTTPQNTHRLMNNNLEHRYWKNTQQIFLHRERSLTCLVLFRNQENKSRMKRMQESTQFHDCLNFDGKFKCQGNNWRYFGGKKMYGMDKMCPCVGLLLQTVVWIIRVILVLFKGYFYM